jgi:hypothetical protein
MQQITGGLPKYGLTLVIFCICNSTVLHIQLDIIYLAFCCYLHLQFFNHHQFRADGLLIPVLRQALSVGCRFRPKLSNLADCLPALQLKFFSHFVKVLQACKITFQFLPGCKDIWAVDFMPVQVYKDR